MFGLQRFQDRFALGAGIYIGSWGVNIYLDFWQWCFSFESEPRQQKVTNKEQDGKNC